MGHSVLYPRWTLALSLLASYFPSSHQRSIDVRQSDGLKWGPCATAPEWGDAASLTCANFTVPLDWTNPTNGQNAVLYVGKRRAANGSPIGTIYTNPGGPGGPGTVFLAVKMSQSLYDITEGKFDIVSWDPRGVGLTTPSITCFEAGANESGDQAALNYSQHLLGSTLNVRSSPDQSDIDRFLANATNIEADVNAFVQGCVDKNKDNLKHVGTVATVRDLVALVDAIEGKGSPIRYWGLSYGSVVGSHLLDLYPDRIGRVVLDGIVDATTYSQGASYLNFGDSIQDTDKALQTFYDACAAAGQALCPIASPGATGATIRHWSNELIDAAYNKAAANSSSVETALLIRLQLSGLTGAARSPNGWANFAGMLQSLYSAVHSSDNPSKRSLARHLDHLPVTKRQQQNFPYDNTISSQFAIWCGDSADDTGVTTTASLNEVVRVTKEISNVDGPLALSAPSTFCHLWKARAIERHSPQGSPKLANPVIVIGNTYDVITPLASARKLVKRLNDGGIRQGVLVQHNGTGHLALEMNSTCTYSIIRRYFTEGVVPDDTLCGVNFNGFVGADNHNTSTSIISAPLSSASARSQNGASSLTSTSIPHLILLFLVAIMSGFLVSL